MSFTKTDLVQKEALEKRYGSLNCPVQGPWNDVIGTIVSHRSVRSYKPNALPDSTLETLTVAAQSAATSSNMQVWSLIAITNQKKKIELAKIAGNQKHIEQCPLFLVWLADLSRNERVGNEEGVEMVVTPYVETFLVSAIDAALAAQNAVIAAESLGLSTVYIGAMRNDPKRVGELLNLPPMVFPVFGLCIGYATEEGQGEIKPRLPQPVVLFEEIYGAEREHELRAKYDEEMSEFSARHEIAADTWTKKVIARMGKLSGMNGREKLISVLHSMGFPLR